MTARLYPAIAEDLLGLLANVNESELADLDIVLLSSAYTFSAAHIDRADLTGVIDTGPSVAGITRTNGTFGITSPYVVPLVASGSTVAAWALVEKTGVAANDRLVYFNNEDTGLPTTTNDQNINVNIPSGIFLLQGTA